MQQLGLIVTMRDAFTREARRVSKSMKSLGGDALEMGRSVRDSLGGPVSFTPLRNALLGASFALFSLNKAVDATTDSFNAQEQALVRLDQTTLRWGRNVRQVQAEVDRLVTTGVMKQAQATTAVTNLLQGRFNEAQIRTFNRGMMDLVAAGMQPGQNFDEVFMRVTEGIRTGNVSQLEALGIPNLQRRMQLLGADPSDLLDPFRQEIARGVLFTVLNQEFGRVEGRFEEFIDSLRGQTLVLNNTLANTKAEIGRAIEPMVLAFTRGMVGMIKGIKDFVTANPQFVRAIFTIALTIPFVLFGLAALKVGLLAIFAVLSGGMAPLLLISGAFITLGLLLSKRQSIQSLGGFMEILKSIAFFLQGVIMGLFSLRDGTITINEELAQELEKRGLLPYVFKAIKFLRALGRSVVSFGQGVLTALQPVIMVVEFLVGALIKVASAFLSAIGAGEEFEGLLVAMKVAGFLFGIVLTALLVKAVIAFGAALFAMLPVILAAGIVLLALLLVVEAVNFAINAIVTALKGIYSTVMLLASVLGFTGRSFGEELQKQGEFLSTGAFGTNIGEGEGFGLLRRSPMLGLFGGKKDKGDLEGEMAVQNQDLADRFADSLRKNPATVVATLEIDGREVAAVNAAQDEINQALSGTRIGG